ncbi:hypothetical protein IEO21_04224 [Rhodonia placenta]|uniref:Uncharacterized protein n=1 Tax=Rhodonia placenta TaxID=104341 RepID=A0A8H7P466_9APHY|nr:hypothetical protein IEO21_04224 [Postia placenta]
MVSGITGRGATASGKITTVLNATRICSIRILASTSLQCTYARYSINVRTVAQYFLEATLNAVIFALEIAIRRHKTVVAHLFLVGGERSRCLIQLLMTSSCRCLTQSLIQSAHVAGLWTYSSMDIPLERMFMFGCDNATSCLRISRSFQDVHHIICIILYRVEIIYTCLLCNTAT